ncbi:hypothetical protein D3C80_2237990 [compost metagenome]
MIEASEITGLCELVNATMKSDETIVADVEYFLKPKYKGTRPVTAAAIANVTILISSAE